MSLHFAKVLDFGKVYLLIINHFKGCCVKKYVITGYVL